jgi:hypothetical protein
MWDNITKHKILVLLEFLQDEINNLTPDEVWDELQKIVNEIDEIQT